MLLLLEWNADPAEVVLVAAFFFLTIAGAIVYLLRRRDPEKSLISWLTRLIDHKHEDE